jgi:UDP-3-O-[3-hydroxymyristoyl] glucosamine N-acyltransferase
MKPKLAFSQAVERFFASLITIEWPNADEGRIHAAARLGSDVMLAPGVVIGSNVDLGDGVSVGPNTCLANCSIAKGVRIGANCSIGLPGFGYERDEHGRYWRFPHIGRVVIAIDVEIGSNTCIDRGAIGDTIVERGVKIDNLVHIAHNVVLRENVVVIANSMLAGSVTVEADAWIAPSAAIKNKLSVGHGSIVGLGAVVIRDVAPHAVVVGNPARTLDPERPR